MATSVIEAPDQEKTLTQTPEAAPQAPAIDSASAVAEASRMVSAQQTEAIAARPAGLSPDLQAWIAEVAQRGYAGTGEVLLWLVGMVMFLAVTTVGIWLNATGTFPHF